MIDEPLPHDAHVQKAHEVMRAVGFTIAGLQWRRGERELQLLREFNRAPPNWPTPWAWRCYPNPHMQKYWENRVG